MGMNILEMESEVKTLYFDAKLDICSPLKDKSLKVVLYIKGMKVPAEISPYQTADNPETAPVFIHVHASQPLLLKWKDKFCIRNAVDSVSQGEGQVLYPLVEKIRSRDLKKRMELMRGLSGTEKEMLRVLSQEKGIHGLTEEELDSFCSVSRETLVQLGKQLEEEGALKIVSFSPLLFLSHDSFDFLCAKILTFLSHFHSDHPGEMGVPLEKIEQKFKLHPRILSLAVKHLSRSGDVKDGVRHIARADFQVQLSPEEEKLLQDLEEMSMQGKLHSISFDELKTRFRLSAKNLDKLLSFLIERKKVVRGKDGFFVHSKWLDELIRKLKSSKEKELSVTEFKQMTGLSRKYAIPLLELLDQMGVTRRRGSSREIL